MTKVMMPFPASSFAVEHQTLISSRLSVALEIVSEVTLVDSAGLELTEIHLPVPSECLN